MKNIAIITARSGSKGLKDKNIKLLAGKPMLAYSIEAARESGIYDCVHVSTDSDYYAEIARKFGADVPFLRTPELAADSATSWDVVRYVLKKYQKMEQAFDMVTLLQPTSPLRKAADITNAYEIFQEKDASGVVAVCEMEHSPLWCNILPKDHCMNGFLSHMNSRQRQSLPDYYRINGAVYMVKSSLVWEVPMELYGEKTYAYVMPKERSIDIDDELDFILVDTILTRNISIQMEN